MLWWVDFDKRGWFDCVQEHFGRPIAAGLSANVANNS